MIASQSSTYNAFGVAGKCLTASPYTSWPGTCTHTKEEAISWWKVSIPQRWKITAVKLTSRRDCCKNRLENIDILVGDDICASNVSIPEGGSAIFECDGVGSEIAVRLRH